MDRSEKALAAEDRAGGGMLLAYRRVGNVAVRLDPRCGICRDVPVSPPAALVGSDMYCYPPRDSLTRPFLPAAHEMMLHGGGRVAEALAAAAQATAVERPQLILV